MSKTTESMTNDHKSGVTYIKVEFKKVMLSLYWLTYFKWLYVGNVKFPHVLTEWRSPFSLVVLQCISTLNSREWKCLHLSLHPFLHNCRSCPKNTRPNALSFMLVLRLFRTHWLICFFISMHFNLSVLQERPSSCTNTDSFSHRVFELSFICKLITCHLLWPQKLGHIDRLVQCMLP
jgi:hypothetical protein